MKLNLGCGNHFPEGWINADIDQHWHEEGKDVSLVRGEPLPWENDTFDQIILFLVLNHVPLDEIDGFLSEVERVLSPKGRLLVLDENYPDGVPDYKIDGVTDGPGYRNIKAWHCYAGSLNKLLHPIFPNIETLWEDPSVDEATLLSAANNYHFTDQQFVEGGLLDWTDSEGRIWPIKGLGQNSCLMISTGPVI